MNLSHPPSMNLQVLRKDLKTLRDIWIYLSRRQNQSKQPVSKILTQNKRWSPLPPQCPSIEHNWRNLKRMCNHKFQIDLKVLRNKIVLRCIHKIIIKLSSTTKWINIPKMFNLKLPKMLNNKDKYQWLRFN